MAIHDGDWVFDPRLATSQREGRVLRVLRNPACLMRVLVVQWNDTGLAEELEEIEFGPLED